MILRDYHEALEYDLLARHVDILDLWRGELSIRRLNVLVGQLLNDRTSALLRALAPDATAWTPGDHIAANTYDLLAHAHFKDPKPYPRPGDAEREEAQRASRFEALQRQNARIRAAREAAT